jgi:tryptophan synthase alpha subunit
LQLSVQREALSDFMPTTLITLNANPERKTSMSRIETTLSALKAQGRKALIPYVMAGFPCADITPELMHGMVDAGADIIELGVPFSPTPSADGPVIQKAGEKAAGTGHWHSPGAGHGARAFRTAQRRPRLWC